MPTYEYRCPEGHTFDRFYRKISDAAPELACPQCGKPAERQLTGGAGFVFKGSGFYLTDYGKNAHRKGPPPGKGSESGGDKAAEGKSGESSASETAESSASGEKPSATTSAESSNKSGTPSAAKPSKPKSDE